MVKFKIWNEDNHNLLGGKKKKQEDYKINNKGKETKERGLERKKGKIVK